MYGDQSAGGPSPVLDFGGDGRGFIGQVRVAGVLLLVAAGVSLLYGSYTSLRSRAQTVTAAAIEEGERGYSYIQLHGRSQAPRTEIVGRLVQADAVVVQRRTPRIYAPLVSGRPGADEHPRIYFGASEADYNRHVSDDRFRGILMPRVPLGIRAAFESHGRVVAGDAYLLEDDGFQGNPAVGHALLVWGSVLGGMGVLALLFAAWRQAASRSESSDAPPETGGAAS